MREVMTMPFPECSFRSGIVLSALQEKNLFFFFPQMLALLCEGNTIYLHFREKQNKKIKFLPIEVRRWHRLPLQICLPPKPKSFTLQLP